jgi:hypothetical protein
MKVCHRVILLHCVCLSGPHFFNSGGKHPVSLVSKSPIILTAVSTSWNGLRIRARCALISISKPCRVNQKRFVGAKDSGLEWT